MLAFFKDAALTRPVSLTLPKRFLAETKGASCETTFWLGDAYSAEATAIANPGANTLTVAQTEEFADSGWAVVNGMTVAYTGRTTHSLTGVSGLTGSVAVGDRVYPGVAYRGVGNLQIGSYGTAGIMVSIRIPGSTYCFPGSVAIFSVTEILPGVTHAVAVDVRVDIPSGVEEDIAVWGISTSPLYRRDLPDHTAPSGYALGVRAACVAHRRDQAVPLHVRLLPAERALPATDPGFIVGQYRFRDDTTENGVPLLVSRWDTAPESIGLEKFVPGIGDQDDLKLEQLSEVGDSILPSVRRGAYFTGAPGYYLPADPRQEILPAWAPAAFGLDALPRVTAPMWVGTFVRDDQDYYDAATRYIYAGRSFVDGLGDLQYTVQGKVLSLQAGLKPGILLAGVCSGQPNDVFELPLYPVYSIDRVWVDRGPGIDPVDISNASFDREAGTLTVSLPDGVSPAEPVYCSYQPAVLVIYDASTSTDLYPVNVDLNPAFSGLSDGFLVLEHRNEKPSALVLSCDKPRIDIPATHDSIVGLAAYGPVYYVNDYAMLLVSAQGLTPSLVVPGARLRVIPGVGFTGQVNYQDPSVEDVEVITGADGTATMVYTPGPPTGVYLALSSHSGTHLTLPAPVPISEIYSSRAGWLVTTYKVRNDDPYLGKLGGDPAKGEVPWQTSGTAGTTSYKTNGWRDPYYRSGVLVRPVDALDAVGHSYTHPSFSGSVVTLVYGSALPTDANIGAWYVNFVEMVTLQMELVDTHLRSNTLLLEMDLPPLITDSPWLRLDSSIQGRLCQNRLGWVPTGV